MNGAYELRGMRIGAVIAVAAGIEVYDPDPSRALSVATSGGIRPVG